MNSIVKKRVKDFVPSLEIKWKLLNEEIKQSLPADVDLSTIESEERVRLAIPDVVDAFYECLKKEKEGKKRIVSELQKTEKNKMRGQL